MKIDKIVEKINQRIIQIDEEINKVVCLEIPQVLRDRKINKLKEEKYKLIDMKSIGR